MPGSILQEMLISGGIVAPTCGACRAQRDGGTALPCCRRSGLFSAAATRTLTATHFTCMQSSSLNSLPCVCRVWLADCDYYCGWSVDAVNGLVCNSARARFACGPRDHVVSQLAKQRQRLVANAWHGRCVDLLHAAYSLEACEDPSIALTWQPCFHPDLTLWAQIAFLWNRDTIPQPDRADRL